MGDGKRQMDAYRIGEGIRNCRKENGLTQKELAKLLKISCATLANYENGKTVPSMDTIMRISTLFGISTDHVMGNYIS